MYGLFYIIFVVETIGSYTILIKFVDTRSSGKDARTMKSMARMIKRYTSIKENLAKS